MGDILTFVREDCSKFPVCPRSNLCILQGVNDQYCMLAFVKLSMRFVNDESAECRAMVSLAVEQLLRSVSSSKFNDVYLATRDWLQSKKVKFDFFFKVLSFLSPIKCDFHVLLDVLYLFCLLLYRKELSPWICCLSQTQIYRNVIFWLYTASSREIIERPLSN